MIDSKTRLIALIGNPVEHSLGPVMHNAAFNHLGLNFAYLAFNVGSPKAAIDAMKSLNFVGYSITIPHKEKIMKYLDRVDPVAARIQAVNTVVNKDNMLIGYNTDANAAICALQRKAELNGKTVALVGAGGVSRAIAFALKDNGALVTIFNRTFLSAKKLAKSVGCEYLAIEKLDGFKADILINATSVGMFPHSNESILDKKALVNFSLVFDVVYNPVETLLLRNAKSLGCETISGLEMFLEQGAEQFKLWTGFDAPREVMRGAVLKGLEK